MIFASVMVQPSCWNIFLAFKRVSPVETTSSIRQIRLSFRGISPTTREKMSPSIFSVEINRGEGFGGVLNTPGGGIVENLWTLKENFLEGGGVLFLRH